MMGLSGIGFALRSGASVSRRHDEYSGQRPEGRAARLHRRGDPQPRADAAAARDRPGARPRDSRTIASTTTCAIRSPRRCAAKAQFIGRGGISLAVVESAVISGNHIYENGASAIRSGVRRVRRLRQRPRDHRQRARRQRRDHDRLRAQPSRRPARRHLRPLRRRADHAASSASSGRKPALRVHDNRVDQPAGRALTVFAFGPVSVREQSSQQRVHRPLPVPRHARRRRADLQPRRHPPADRRRCSARYLGHRATASPAPGRSRRCRAARRCSTTTTCGWATSTAR